MNKIKFSRAKRNNPGLKISLRKGLKIVLNKLKYM